MTTSGSGPSPDGGYDAELFGTGAESANGQSAVALGDTAATASPTSTAEAVTAALTGVVPPLVLHGSCTRS